MKGRLTGLGIDTGGSFTKLIAIAESGAVLGKAQIPTLSEKGPRDFIRRAAQAVRALERRLGRSLGDVCLAVAGDVDPRRGRLRRSPNLPRFEDFPLRDTLRVALDRQVEMHNDANMAAWGCYTLELRRRFPNVLGITMGTGIGGGVVQGGKLYTGSTGSAGEFGHMRVVPGGERCGCGASGCLEAYAGKAGIAKLAARLLEESPAASPRLRAAAKGGDGLDPEVLARAAQAGDPVAREVWRRVGAAMGVGIVNLVYLFNPDAVVIAGGVSQAGAFFMDPIRRALAEESFRTPFTHVRVTLAKRAQLGSLGAAMYALEGAD